MENRKLCEALQSMQFTQYEAVVLKMRTVHCLESLTQCGDIYWPSPSYHICIIVWVKQILVMFNSACIMKTENNNFIYI